MGSVLTNTMQQEEKKTKQGQNKKNTCIITKFLKIISQNSGKLIPAK